MSGNEHAEFDKNKSYGGYSDLTDEVGNDFQQFCIVMASYFIPPGYAITVACKGKEMAWRYPACPDLVPEGWESKTVVVPKHE